MEFNNKAPEWVNEGTAPSEELKNTGFVGGYKPPASVFNYMFNQYSKSIGETQEKLIATETKTNKNIEEIQEDIENLENGTAGLKPSEVVEGETIHVENSANLPFVGLNVYGKSTQDGEPTPDAPIDIVSVGDSGSIEVGVYGKNLIPYPYYQETVTAYGVTFTAQADGGILGSGIATDATGITIYDGKMIKRDGIVNLSLRGTFENITWQVTLYDASNNDIVTFQSKTRITINLDEYPNAERMRLIVKRSSNGEVSGIAYPQLELGDTATDYEQPKGVQSLTLSTPNGLAGIPVTSGGNYTDTEGQEWICDEIDLERGVYIQRIYTKIFSGNETFGMHDTVLEDEDYYFSYYNDNFIHISDANSLAGTLCTHLVEQTANNLWRTSVNGFSMNTSGNHIRFRFLNITSVDELSTQLSEWYDNGTPLTIIGELATPIETPLTDAEIEAYKALTTNMPNTTILNDCVAQMKVEYVTQAYDGALNMVLNNAGSEDALTSEDVVDELTSENANVPLSANQGRVLNEGIGSLTTNVNTNTSNILTNTTNISNLTTRVTNVENAITPIQASTTDLTAGTSELASGTIYCVYE